MFSASNIGSSMVRKNQILVVIPS